MVKKLPHRYSTLLFQIVRFGIVGVSATAVQFLAVIIQAEFLGVKPIIANAVALIFSMVTKYLGHRYWTFNNTSGSHRKTIPKFLSMVSVTFVINETLYSILLYKLHVQYIMALSIVTIIVASINFLTGKFWTFRAQNISQSTISYSLTNRLSEEKESL